MERESFVCYQSFYEAIRSQPKKQQLELYQALFEYALYGKEVPLPPRTKGIFALMKPQLDANNKRYAAAVKGGEARKNKLSQSGTAAEGETCGTKKDSTAAEKRGAEGEPMAADGAEPNEKGNENEKEKENGKEKEKGKEKAASPQSLADKTTTFFPPSLEEAESYCLEMGYAIDAAHFIDYYTGNGWMVGKNKMQDWKAVLRNWARQEAEWQKGTAYEKKQKTTGNWDDYNGIVL